jgi:hypothetical protein
MVKAKPYVGEDETLIEGTMTVTLSQNPQATSCKNIIQMEKLLLTYLADNIGSESRFQIACVYTLDNAREGKELSGGESVESTALEYRLTFIQKTEDNNRLFQQGRRSKNIFERRRNRALAQCSDIDKAMCCSQYAINGEMGEYCSSVGCGSKYCGSGRRKRKRKPDRDERKAEEADAIKRFRVFDYRRSNGGRPKPIPEPYIGEVPNVNACDFYGELTGFNWNDSVHTYSEFKPQVSRSLLGVGDVTSVSLCNCNRFSIEEFSVPALSCSEFKKEKCMQNEDLVADGTPIDRTTPINVPLNLEANLGVEQDEQINLGFDAISSSENDVNSQAIESVTVWQPEKDLIGNSGCRVAKGIIILSAIYALHIFDFALLVLS